MTEFTALLGQTVPVLKDGDERYGLVLEAEVSKEVYWKILSASKLHDVKLVVKE